MRATPRLGVSLRDLLPEEEAARCRQPITQTANSEGADRSERRRLLVVEKLVKEYPRKGAPASLAKMFGAQAAGRARDFPRRRRHQLFRSARGESVGLVGESGCGKSTTSMMVMRLIDKTSGRITFDGEEIGDIPARKPSRRCRCARASRWCSRIRPTASIRASPPRAPSPIRCCGSATSAGATRCARAARNWPALVGLPLNLLDRFPHQLSGGQKARVGIARAIALKPELVILDEPTAALDVSVQAVVLNLLQDLKESLGMSYLFVSHDLNVVRLLCDRVIVMRTGRIVEQGPTERVLGDPQDAYTRELLTAIPHPPLPVP